MIKYFCDKCGNEVESNGLVVPMYAYDAIGTKLAFLKNNLLCEKCVEKFNMIKDRLEHEEDFFDMSDKQISLMEYDFKVGDKVVTSTGQVGVIKSICGCVSCIERGFYEPKVVTTAGVGDIYITNNDRDVNFRSFYRIGKYCFGNIDIDCIKYDIKSETKNLEEATNNLKEYHAQYKRMRLLEALGSAAEAEE